MPRGDERFQFRKRNGDALGKGCCCGRIWAEGCFDSENWETGGWGDGESLGISETEKRGLHVIRLKWGFVLIFIEQTDATTTLTYPTATPTQVVEPILLNKNATTYRTFIEAFILNALTLLHKYTTCYFLI
jgi:hypothetical protein